MVYPSSSPFHPKVDIAFASIWVTLDQNRFVTLSIPWYDVYLHFLVPRPHRTSSFWALKKPFSKKIWCLLLSALLLHSLYTYVRSWIDSKFPKRKKKKSFEKFSWIPRFFDEEKKRKEKKRKEKEKRNNSFLLATIF